MLAADLADDARHWIRMAGPVERGARIVEIDPLERSGEAVRVAFAALFTVGNDIEAGALLVSDCEKRRIVLGLFEKSRIYAPQFLRANTKHAIKITVPGPFTMSQQAQNDFYKDEQEMVLDYAAAVNAEIKDLFAAGADIVQIDEPYMQARPEKARQYGLRGLDAALAGVTRTTAIHICFGYAAIIHVRPSGYSFLPELAASPVQQISIETAQSNLDCSVRQKLPGKMIILGTLDLSDMAIESPETVAARIRRALSYVSADRIVVAPDCGLKYLPRDVAFGKMRAMVDGANIVRQELKAR